MEANDMKAMREALKLFAHMNDDGYYNQSAQICNIVAKAQQALAAPPRQCDVGTPEEQVKRFHDYCEAFMDNDGTCTGCPCCGHPFSKCEFVWAQMPYEADAQKGDKE